MQNRVGLDAKHDPTPSCCSSSLIFNTTTAIHGCELTSLACLKLATFSAGALLLFVTVRPDYHALGSARMCHGILIHSRPSHSVFAHSYLPRSSFPSTCICSASVFRRPLHTSFVSPPALPPSRLPLPLCCFCCTLSYKWFHVRALCRLQRTLGAYTDSLSSPLGASRPAIP